MNGVTLRTSTQQFLTQCSRSLQTQHEQTQQTSDVFTEEDEPADANAIDLEIANIQIRAPRPLSRRVMALVYAVRQDFRLSSSA